MTKQETRKVNKLLDKFDFRTCQIAMLIKNWNYAGKEVTIDELTQTAKQCLTHLIDRKYDEVLTGGFTARRVYDDGKEVGITLTFELEEQWL